MGEGLGCGRKLERWRWRFGSHTEELLAAAALLNNLDQARLQLLDGGNVVGQDTHLSGLGGEVDLDDILGLEDRLFGADN